MDREKIYNTTENVFTVAGKQITLYGGSFSDNPLVIYHAGSDEGNEVWEDSIKIGCPSFTLAKIQNIDWNHEMSPWKIQAISKHDAPCTGGADEYLLKLTDEILPAILHFVSPSRIYLAGYSLAGLFALYAAYKTDIFSGLASVSGSLWYPGIVEFVQSNEISKSMKQIYLSLGDRESKTRNPVLSVVEENTLKIEAYLRTLDCTVIYERNCGNHFQENTLRMAKGIKWLLML